MSLKSMFEKHAMHKVMSEIFDDAANSDCEISIKHVKDGDTNMHVSGSRVSIMILLAAAEKQILNKIDCSEEEFEMIKDMTGSKVVSEDVKIEKGE